MSFCKTWKNTIQTSWTFNVLCSRRGWWLLVFHFCKNFQITPHSPQVIITQLGWLQKNYTILQLWVFFSSRTYLSPFTKDIRGEDQWDESHSHFSKVPLRWGTNKPIECNLFKAAVTLVLFYPDMRTGRGDWTAFHDDTGSSPGKGGWSKHHFKLLHWTLAFDKDIDNSQKLLFRKSFLLFTHLF